MKELSIKKDRSHPVKKLLTDNNNTQYHKTMKSLVLLRF